MDSFYKVVEKLNDREAHRKTELAQDIALPLGLLTLLVGFWYTLANGILFPLSTAHFVVALLLAVSGVFLVYSAALLWRAHVGNTYKALPLATDLAAYRSSLVDWGMREGVSEAEVENVWNEYFHSKLIENATHNAEMNERRSATILKQKQMLGATLVALAIAGGTALVCGINLKP